MEKYINDFLDNPNNNLFELWSALGINNLYANVYQDLEDDTEEVVVVANSGDVIVSGKLTQEIEQSNNNSSINLSSVNHK